MEQPKFCTNCGSPLERDDMFCSSCGSKVEREQCVENEQYVERKKDIENNIYEDSPSPKLSKKKTSSKNILSLALVAVMVIVAIGTGFYLKNRGKNEKILTQNNDSSTVKDNNTEKKGSTTPDSTQKTVEKKDIDINNPLTYISKENKKYTYYAEYPDGSKETFDLIAGKIPGVPILTLVTLIPQSEPDTMHILKRNDGLYTVLDTDTSAHSLDLPNELTEGKEWTSNGVKCKILKTNDTCDMGFKKFENCLVVRRNYEDTGYSFKMWYAPEVGLVKATYEESGKIYTELKAIADAPAADIQEQIIKYSPNINTIK